MRKSHLAIAAVTGAEQQDCRQRDPAAHRMHDDRASEIVELLAEAAFSQAWMPKPGSRRCLQRRDNEADDEEGGGELRVELGALSNAAGNDRRDGGRKGEQEEELVSSNPFFSASTSAPTKKWCRRRCHSR